MKISNFCVYFHRLVLIFNTCFCKNIVNSTKVFTNFKIQVLKKEKRTDYLKSVQKLSVQFFLFLCKEHADNGDDRKDNQIADNIGAV